MINLDWETEGSFDIGAAGGEHVNINAAYQQTPSPTDQASYVVKIQGLTGGHSGMEINNGHGHATKLLVRLLKEAYGTYQLRLASIVGGTASNAIHARLKRLSSWRMTRQRHSWILSSNLK